MRGIQWIILAVILAVWLVAFLLGVALASPFAGRVLDVNDVLAGGKKIF